MTAKTNSISLEYYLNLLKRENLSIKIKKNEIKKNEIDLKQSYYNFLPTIDFSYGATLNSSNGSAFSSFLPSSTTSTNPSWSKNLSINLPIFLGGKRFELIKISSSNSKISLYDLEYTILELKSKAISLFIKAYNAQNQLIILNQALKLSKENYDRAMLLKSVGRMVEVDLLTFKLSYEERKNAILNLKTELNNTFIEISSLISQNIELSTLKINKNIPENIIKLRKKELEKKYIKKMKKNSPLIKKLKEYHNISKYNLDLSFRNYYPNISMRYNYSPYTTNFWEFPLTIGHSLALVLNFNIFNSYSDSSEYKKNKLNLLNANIQLQEIVKSQEYAIKRAINILKNSLFQVKSAKLAISLSKEMLKQVKIGYNAGKYTYLDLMKAENDYFLKENNFLSLEMQIYNSYHQLKIISGDSK